MERRQISEESEEHLHDEVETLIDWAEVEEETVPEPYHLEPDEEPCESDIVDDRVGLPGGTVGDTDLLASSADEEQ